MKQNKMMNCTIISPKEERRYGDVQSVVLPALYGQAQILPGHAESFLLLVQGAVVIRQRFEEHEKTIQITGGECHVRDNSVTVIL